MALVQQATTEHGTYRIHDDAYAGISEDVLQMRLNQMQTVCRCILAEVAAAHAEEANGA